MAVAMAKATIPNARTKDDLKASFAPKGIQPYKYDRNQVTGTDRFKNAHTLYQSFRYDAVNPNKNEKSPVRYRRREKEPEQQTEFKNTTKYTASLVGAHNMHGFLTQQREDQ